MTTPQEVQKLNENLRPLALADRLKLIANTFPDLEFPTTLGTDDQLITWAIIEGGGSNINIATPLTGALLNEAKTLLEITNERYDIKIGQQQPADDSIWISGKCQQLLVADRSVPIISWNTKRATLHINPLADWSFQEVLHAVAEHEVPINPLFDTPTSEHAKTRPHLDNRKSDIAVTGENIRGKAA